MKEVNGSVSYRTTAKAITVAAIALLALEGCNKQTALEIDALDRVNAPDLRRIEGGLFAAASNKLWITRGNKIPVCFTDSLLRSEQIVIEQAIKARTTAPCW